MAVTLRDYQRAAVDATFSYFAENEGHPLVVVPTGGGKTVILGTFVREVYDGCPTIRILIVTHVKELISQGYEGLMRMWPDAPAGVFSAGLGKRQINAQILFAGIQSIHSRAYSLQKVDLVLVDESHLIPRKANTTYRKFLDDLLVINPNMRMVGYTGTPFRMDSGRLHVGDDRMFTDIAYEVNIRDLIEDGYLTAPVSPGGLTQIDTTGVGTRGGEFIAGALEDAATDPAVVSAICDEIVRHGEYRHGWLVYGCGKDHCTMLRDGLRERGVACGAVFGDTPASERLSLMNGFKRRELRALVSMGVLTTGIDVPHADMIAVARPTKSPGLWSQIVGRGTRLLDPKWGSLPTREERLAAIANSAKPDFCVLDFGQNTSRLGTIDALKIVGEKDKSALDAPAEMPTKACLNHPMCEQRSPISARECVACGCPFPDAVAKISSQASALSILSTAPRVPEWIDVSSVSYRAWPGKDGKPPTVCVTYQCGLLQHREWWCPEHQGYPRDKFVRLWREATGQRNPPANVEGVLETRNLIRDPVQIQVRPEGKYVAIVGRRYEQGIAEGKARDHTGSRVITCRRCHTAMRGTRKGEWGYEHGVIICDSPTCPAGFVEYQIIADRLELAA